VPLRYVLEAVALVRASDVVASLSKFRKSPDMLLRRVLRQTRELGEMGRGRNVEEVECVMCV